MNLKMEVYNEDLELIGILETYSSLLIEDWSFDAGSFSLESILNEETRPLLVPDNIIWFGDKIAGRIEYVYGQNTNLVTITIKGRLLKGILDTRILWGLYNLKGKASSLMTQLVIDNAISPTRGDFKKRKIPNLTTEIISRLPEGYTEVEYIESSGTQYIDTGFVAGGNTEVLADFDISPEYVQFAGLFGSREGPSGNAFCLWASSPSFRDDYAAITKRFTQEYAGRHLVDKKSNTTTIDSETITHEVSDFQCVNTSLIFAIKNGNVADPRMSSAKLYSFKIYDNGILARDFIPCIDSSGVVGLYDLVSKAFFTNVGTGNFIPGSEVDMGTKSIPNEPIIRIQKTGGSLLEALSDMGSSQQVFFDVEFNPKILKMEFVTRVGVNRTIHQNDVEQVFFGTELDDILESSYTYNSQDYKNSALVAGEGEGSERKLLEVLKKGEEDLSGLQRRELWIDARDLQAHSTLEEGELTPEEYEGVLKTRGEEKLSERQLVQSFDANMRTKDPTYVFGKDFFLGDTITAIDKKLGIIVDALVEGVEYSYVDGIENLTLTLGYSSPTIYDKLRKEGM